MAVSSRQIGHHTISGNISLFQIHQKLKKVVLRLQSANFVTKPSVVAVVPETEKLLETMSVEYDFIPKATRDAVRAKWMQRWTDLLNPLYGAGYCLDPEFHSHDHSACAEGLKDLLLMCDKVHGTGSAACAPGPKQRCSAWNRKCRRAQDVCLG